jgi:GNAT superfamily N-acetyltransferase
MRITAVSQPEESDFDVLKKGLNGFNERHTGTVYRETVSSFVKDEDDKTVGGILGEIKWGWLYIEGLWIADDVRGSGLGAKLLQQLEAHALSKGVSNFRLETTSFQALDFYVKQGYTLFGQLPDMPPTFTSYFLKKQTGI